MFKLSADSERLIRRLDVDDVTFFVDACSMITGGLAGLVLVRDLG